MKYEIYQQVGNYKPVYLESYKKREQAELHVRKYEREVKQDLAEGYGFPQGIPQWTIVEA